MGSEDTSQTGASTRLLCPFPLPAGDSTRGQGEGLALTLPLGWVGPASKTDIPVWAPLMASQQLAWREQRWLIHRESQCCPDAKAQLGWGSVGSLAWGSTGAFIRPCWATHQREVVCGEQAVGDDASPSQ